MIRNIAFQTSRVIGIALLLAACLVAGPRGGAAQDAAALVQNLGNQAIQVLGPSVSPAQRTAHFRRLFEADFDLPGGKGTSLSKKLTDATFNLAHSAVSSVIPYRGVVREVTGAEKRARSVNEALLAGTVRRAYLKGYGEMLGCAYPASPRRPSV